MTINENKMLSRSRKRRIERKNKMNKDMKIFINKIKTEKKEKNIDKIEELETLFV